jgi:glycosyltransferase involved in cell wall biosynthesis
LAAKELRIPFVTTFHGTYGTENFFKKKYNSVMLKSDAVIAISKFIKTHIKEKYNFDKNIYIIPRGVNKNIFSPKEVSSARLINAAKEINTEGDDKIILLPGRLTEWKGHSLAIQAVAKLSLRKFKLVIIGDVQGRFKYKQKLINLATNLDLQNRVTFINHTRDLPAFLLLSDLVLSCSTKPEAFGRTILEAQAMGRPVIAFNHGGSIELIEENKNGILSEVGDIEKLALNIEKSLNIKNSSRVKLSKVSISNVNKNYLTEFMCKKTINLYRNLIRNLNSNEKNTNN